MDNDEEIQKIKQELKEKRKNKSSQNSDVKLFKPISSRHTVRKISNRGRKKSTGSLTTKATTKTQEDPELEKALETFITSLDEKDEGLISREEILGEYEKFRKLIPKGLMKKVELEKVLMERDDLFVDSSDLDEQIETIFRVFAKEGSNSLSFVEYLMTIKTLKGNSAKEKLEWIFKVYDKNEMGFIEVEELTKMMNVLCNMSGYDIAELDLKDLCEHILGILDTDGDGRIDNQEFIEGTLSSPLILNILCPDGN